MEKTNKKKKKRKLKGWTKVALVVLNIVAFVAILLLVLNGVYRSYYNKMNYEEVAQRTEFGRGIRRVLEGDIGTLMWADHVHNILLIGHDSGLRTNTGRSDAMILVSINKETEELIMTSLMRDSYVYIPGHGADRLNQAYMEGGASLLIETVEMNFDIRIDNYATIDVFAFMDVVDALGGVELTVSDEEVEVMNRYITQLNKLEENPRMESVLSGAGTYHMNGIQTLAFCRVRYAGNADFERTERQREVLTILLNRFKECDLAELNEVLNVVLPNVTTDINQDTLLSLLTNAVVSYLNYELVQYRVPYDGSYTSFTPEEDKLVLSIDIEANSKYMIENIYGVHVKEEE